MNTYNWKNKHVLVTGGTGMVGQALVNMLLERGAIVRVASLDDRSRANPHTAFLQGNLMDPEFCQRIVKEMDAVFHVAGIKGSVSLGKKRAASFFTPTILMNTVMMDAAYRAGVERYLYTSTVGIYPPADVFYETNAWSGPPYEVDKYAGWAKRMGELQAEAYATEYGWTNIAIVRPTNIYGPWDNFDPATAMVIPALIARAATGENPLTVWGDGSPVRDFIYSEDCARGMLMALEQVHKHELIIPYNLSGGRRVSIRQVAEIICKNFPDLPSLKWDASKPAGQALRVLDGGRAKDFLGFEAEIPIEEGIRRTVEWYIGHLDSNNSRYNVFHQKSFV